jgi:hypothetical protein
MSDRRGVIARVSTRLRSGHGFIGKAGMLHRRAQDDFFLLVHMRQFMAPIAGDFKEALLEPRARVPAIEILVGVHAREMYVAMGLAVPRVEDLRRAPFLPSIQVMGPRDDGNVTGGFLADESLDEADMLERIVTAIEAADAVMGSRDRVIATWRRKECLPGFDPDSSALCAAFVLGLNGDVPGGKEIIEEWIPRLTAAHLVAWFEESLVKLRTLAERGKR